MHNANAFDRINGLDGDRRKLVDDYTHLATRPSPLLLQKALATLELRWRLEEAVLIPSLEGTSGVMEGRSEDAGRELLALRSLAALIMHRELSVESRMVLLRALDTLANLRSERVHGSLNRAQRSALIDARALGEEMERLLDAWHPEVRVLNDDKVQAAAGVDLTLN